MDAETLMEMAGGGVMKYSEAATLSRSCGGTQEQKANNGQPPAQPSPVQPHAMNICTHSQDTGHGHIGNTVYFLCFNFYAEYVMQY